MVIEDNTTQNQDTQRNTKNKSNGSFTNSKPKSSLPVEMVLEILQWLPVLSLLKCRSVCKLWLSLISGPNFIKTHYLKSVESSQFAHHRLIFRCTELHINIKNSPVYRPRCYIKNCSVYSLLNEPFCKAVEVDYPMKHLHNKVQYVGSCNGLFCLAMKEDALYLWNPATRKSRRLRNSEMNLGDDVYVIYGFGYDECNDDYKVVGTSCVNQKEDTYVKEVKIYSSRSDCWRRVEDFPFGFPMGGSGKFANGALHWAASRNIRSKSPDSWVIVSFDLKTENYGELVQPNYEEGTYDLTLSVLERSICVLCIYEDIRADVWVMKEYGVKESWTKLVSIPYIQSPCWDIIPLCVPASGDVLLKLEMDIVVYSSKDNRFKDIKITNYGGCREADTYIYVESLVSPYV